MCCSRYGLARSPALPMDGTFPAHHIHEAVDFLSSSSRGVVIVEFQIITSRLLQATACVRLSRPTPQFEVGQIGTSK